MAAAALEVNRNIGSDGIQLLLAGECGIDPLIVDPAAADDPLTGLGLLGGLGDQRKNFFLRLAHSDELQLQLTCAEDVQMGVGQTGQHHLTLQVDHRGIGSAACQHLLIRADHCKAILYYAEGLRYRILAIHGIDLTVDISRIQFSHRVYLLQFTPAHLRRCDGFVLTRMARRPPRCAREVMGLYKTKKRHPSNSRYAYQPYEKCIMQNVQYAL